MSNIGTRICRIREHGGVSITDPDCGICQTVTFPDGSSRQINHLFPKALEHHYPLPPLNTTSVPVYRGYWNHVGTAYRGVIFIDFEPSPRLMAHGVREVTFPGGLPPWLGMREPARWVDPDALALPKRKPPVPPKTTVAPRTKAQTNARQTFTHLRPIEIGKRENVHGCASSRSTGGPVTTDGSAPGLVDTRGLQ